MWCLGEQAFVGQAPREKREGEGERTKTRGDWEREKGGKEKEAPFLSLLFLSPSLPSFSSPRPLLSACFQEPGTG